MQSICVQGLQVPFHAATTASYQQWQHTAHWGQVFSCDKARIACLQKPTANELPLLVAPVAEHMQAATALTEGRRSAVFNHQKTAAEALHALSWMVYTGPNCGMY